jgi:hypothetical protein
MRRERLEYSVACSFQSVKQFLARLSPNESIAVAVFKQPAHLFVARGALRIIFKYLYLVVLADIKFLDLSVVSKTFVVDIAGFVTS